MEIKYEDQKKPILQLPSIIRLKGKGFANAYCLACRQYTGTEYVISIISLDNGTIQSQTYKTEEELLKEFDIVKSELTIYR